MGIHWLPTWKLVKDYSDCQSNFVEAAKIYILVLLQLPWEQRIAACRKGKSHYGKGDFNWM